MRRWSVLAALVICAAAWGQYQTGFEPPDFQGAKDGVVLTGQDKYYLPTNDSVDWKVYTYQDNAFGMGPNPQGGQHFVGGIGPGGSPLKYARAQRDVTWGTGIWTAQYDMGCKYQGVPPPVNNIGSFSAQPGLGGSNATFIHLMTWEDPNTRDDFQALYLTYDATGKQATAPGSDPGPAWNNLKQGNWYRFWTTIDFDKNKILEVAVQDLTGGGQVVKYQPSEWYLAGGASGKPVTTGFRMFAGSSKTGNGAAFDNISITPEPTSVVLLLLATVALRRR